MAAKQDDIRKSRAQSLSKDSRGRSSSRDQADTSGNLPKENSPSKDDAWLCDTCEKLYIDKDDKLMTCEYCGQYRCIACLCMTKTVYKAIRGRVYLPYICDGPKGCIGKSLTAIKDTKSIEDRCNEFMSGFAKKVDDRMQKMEQEMKSVKDGMSDMKADIVKEIKDNVVGACAAPSAAQQVSDPDINTRELPSTNAKEILGSIQDKMDRKNNIVFYNVKEGPGNLIGEKVKYDKVEVKAIASEMGVELNDVDMLSVRRFGKKDALKKVHGEEVKVPRIMCVTFTENVKADMMKNAYKLQFSGDEYIKRVGLKHDMSKDERMKEVELRKEAKDKSDENFLFLVRGPVWDRKIIRVPARKPVGSGAVANSLSAA